MTLNPQYPTPAAATADSIHGHNDISCRDNTSMFTKGGVGTLTLNTVNAN
ncbi:hypothetical protein [Candidatus Finniella inopinata]|nr:hypothetical protein [Candidatus Finniella inopinata]